MSLFFCPRRFSATCPKTAFLVMKKKGLVILGLGFALNEREGEDGDWTLSIYVY